MNLLLGISGGIAAYKTPELVRRLKDAGVNVRVVMTRSAHQFVTSTTLQAVSGEPVRDNLWDESAEAAMGHIELSRWADAVLIAPATAEIIARLAQGGAGDLLSTLCLATRAPVTVAPAMNNAMWEHAAVRANLETLEARGVRIAGPAEGAQACGEFGPGRMLEPDELVATMLGGGANGALAGRTVVITAGPTHEAIDPVRYISNHSSGKMGYALAEAAYAAGAKVLLLSGPVTLPTPRGVERVDVESAEQLHAAAHRHARDADIFIAAAAVADYRPLNPAGEKIKKKNASLALQLERTADVLASVAALDEPPFTVGFAAETENVEQNALAKLDTKRLKMIVANEVGEGKVFGSDDNTITAYWKGGSQNWPTASKKVLAQQLIALIAERLAAETIDDTITELPKIAMRDRPSG